MSFLPPPRGNLDREVTRAEEQALELKAEHYAQTHLSRDERGRLGTEPQRLLHRLYLRLTGKRTSD